jgi:hypothetical protein
VTLVRAETPNNGKPFTDDGSDTTFSNEPTPTTQPEHKPKQKKGNGSVTIQQAATLTGLVVTPSATLTAPGTSVTFQIITNPAGIPWGANGPEATLSFSGGPSQPLGQITASGTRTDVNGVATITVTASGSLSGIITLNVSFGGFTKTATMEVGHVDFNNNTRQGDKVVVSKGGALNLPGGKKQIEVKVTPAGTTAVLTIKRIAGTAGSAFFAGGTTSTTVTGTQNVTIFGGDLSSDPRNLVVEVKIGETVRNTFIFTSFGVELTPFVAGASTQIPAAAKTQGGTGAQSLKDLYDANKPDKQFGYTIDAANGRIQGGIYHQGKVLPAGMNPADFGTGRDNGFDGTRLITIRMYFPTDCLGVFPGQPTLFFYTENEIDDPSDLGEDERPDADIAGDTHLYLHTIDVVNRPMGFIAANQTMRLRFNAFEFFTYGREQASNMVKWYFAFSGQKNAAGVYAQLNDLPAAVGDNKVDKNVHVIPSANMAAPAGNAPANVMLTQPAGGVVVLPVPAPGDVAIKITGQNLNDPTCPIRVLFRLQDILPNTTAVHRIDAKNIVVNAAGTEITADINLGGAIKKGKYTLQVFKDGHPAGEQVDALEIK